MSPDEPHPEWFCVVCGRMTMAHQTNGRSEDHEFVAGTPLQAPPTDY